MEYLWARSVWQQQRASCSPGQGKPPTLVAFSTRSQGLGTRGTPGSWDSSVALDRTKKEPDPRPLWEPQTGPDRALSQTLLWARQWCHCAHPAKQRWGWPVTGGTGGFSTHQPQIWTFLFSSIQGNNPGFLLPFTAAAPQPSLKGGRLPMAMVYSWLLMHGRGRSPSSHGLRAAQLLACSQI